MPKHPYTLAELMVVILIISLVLALALPRLARTPSGPFVRKVLSEIQRPFDEAALRARATGRSTRLELDLSAHAFRLTDLAPLISQATPDKGTDTDTVENLYQVDRELVWENATEQQAVDSVLTFTFHDNGEAAGPDLHFACRKRHFTLTLDRLTGDTNIHQHP